VEEGGGVDEFILVGQSSPDKSDRGRGFAGFTVSYAICLALQGPWTRLVSTISTGCTASDLSLVVGMQSILHIGLGEYVTLLA
jgi:hypothetical protein